MSEYDFKGDVHCAGFIGGDKNITNYGFGAEDIVRRIEKVMELMQIHHWRRYAKETHAGK